jgi:hypothetical protein
MGTITERKRKDGSIGFTAQIVLAAPALERMA